MRLSHQPGERIDRERKVVFFYRGKPVEAFEGDTIGSALFADGRRVFSRSFKYHRRRGLVCCSGHCPNCMMQVDGTPNVRVCAEPVRSGMRVEPQNVRGSLERDLMAATDKFGGPFTPVGFYYRTMIRPRRMWPVYEHFLRSVAGLGRIDKHAERSRRHDVEHMSAEVLVIGGGRSGIEAAHEAAARGAQVVVVDEGPDHVGRRGDEPFELLAPARAIGIYEGGLVPIDAGTVLHRIRAERIVVATGSLEQPLVFPGNDLVGIMLPGGSSTSGRSGPASERSSSGPTTWASRWSTTSSAQAPRSPRWSTFARPECGRSRRTAERARSAASTSTAARSSATSSWRREGASRPIRSWPRRVRA
jgi:sarcosine oxidase subunit alpha